MKRTQTKMNSGYFVYVHIFPNGKVYVGITKQEPKRRWANGRGYVTDITRKAISKYGWENISHIILCEGLKKEEAEDEEIRLIKLYNSTDNRYGYNLSAGGMCGAAGTKQTEEHKKRIADAKKKRVVQYSISGNALNEYDSIKSAADAVGGSFRTISSVCNRGKRTAYGYVWRFFGDHFDLPEKKVGGSHKIAKKTIAYEKSGEIAAVFDSAYAAAKMTGIKKQNIIACCNGKVKSAGGYVWKYSEMEGDSDNGEE